MPFPEFFAAVPRLRFHDPLAELLGAADRGLIDYGYADAVKLAGHSCPTVAAAYGLTRRAVLALYGDALPQRGEIAVDLAAAQADGVAGVIASVVALLTGAAGGGGFKGLGGRFARCDLMRFGVALPLDLRFRRRDNGSAVDARSDLSRVPGDPELGALMSACLSGAADAAVRQRFAAAWQDRVRRILIDHGDDPGVFVVRPAA